jgi:hypothetical protein
MLALACAAGCASAGSLDPVVDVTQSAPKLVGTTYGTLPLDWDLTLAIEKRLSDLKARGGYCSSYAAALESSYRSGQITLRPFMWRVGSQLASGEAKPNGDMILAREIDPLNVGVRTVDDLLWTMEHEAAHIAFKIENGVTEDRADDYVRACKSPFLSGER